MRGVNRGGIKGLSLLTYDGPFLFYLNRLGGKREGWEGVEGV